MANFFDPFIIFLHVVLFFICIFLLYEYDKSSGTYYRGTSAILLIWCLFQNVLITYGIPHWKSQGLPQNINTQSKSFQAMYYAGLWINLFILMIIWISFNVGALSMVTFLLDRKLRYPLTIFLFLVLFNILIPYDIYCVLYYLSASNTSSSNSSNKSTSNYVESGTTTLNEVASVNNNKTLGYSNPASFYLPYVTSHEQQQQPFY